MISKKLRLNRKIFTVLAIVFFVCGFMTTTVWSAKKVKLIKDTAKGFMKQLNAQGGAGQTLEEVLGLSSGDELRFERKRVDFNRVTHTRHQQYYKGLPVWGAQTIVSRDNGNKVTRLHGDIVHEVSTDVGTLAAGYDPQSALERMKADHIKTDKNAKWNFENEKAGTYVYINSKGKARICYIVSFFADTETGNPSRNIYFIRVKNNKILDSYDMLMHADGQGPGGNLKVGQYYYGGATPDYPAFGVTQNGSTCTMSTTDVKTVNLNHGTSGSTAYSFTCPENTVKEINGAYSPLNDAQYFGQVVFDMYQDWYGQPVLTFQLTMRVHYSTNYENAFWNGSSMTFGDGYSTFYPLVSLDVAAHEVAHGFTEQNSDLVYANQSGGINEAYSDMAGEAAEFYMKGSNDFLLGYDIFKAAGQALRYMADPPQDGLSIDHVDDYYSGLNVHYSSGVYNKAFWVLATTTGWDTHKAFDVFTKANIDYWTTGTTFQQGAEGVLDATADYSYNCQNVVDAFAVVGISLVCPGPPTADFSGTPTSGGQPLTVTFTDLSSGATSWSWSFGDTGTSTSQNPTYVYSNVGTYTVSLTATNSSGSDVKTKTDYITVTPPVAPIADFNASTTSPYIGQVVTFTDATANSPTGWSWTFDSGTPATSTAQNPTVTYDTVGTYDVTLTASNTAGNDTITKTGYITVTDVPLVYCDSQGNNYSYEYIGNVTIADIDNTTAGSNYTDYTSIAAHVNAGDTVNVSLTPVFPSTIYTEYWKIWIDFNADGDFTDAGEEVFSDVSTSTVTGTLSIPAGASGTTRMRVTMKWDAVPTPCETFSYGEVEDYTIVITGGSVDPPVADFSASATNIYEGDTVNFTDLSTNTPTSWAWTFTGGTPGTSSAQNPAITYNTAGTYAVELTATNSGGSDGELKTAYITVNPVVVDPPVADFSASATTITEGQSVTFTDASTNTPTSWAWTFDGGTPASSTAQNPTITYNSAGTYDVTLTATNAGGSDGETKTGYITVNPVTSGIVMETGTLSGVTNSWQTVTLTNTYTSPVVVCANDSGSAGLPAVVRVRNAAGNSFDVMVQNPGGTALTGYNVYYTVVEEGVYSAGDGAKMEAVLVNSTATAQNNSWVEEAQSFQNSYTSPVVLGQVMTANDAGWSVFWANGTSRQGSPTAAEFNAGKEVAEDTDVTRANESIGYIVIEAGSGTINGKAYTAGFTSDTIRGPGNNAAGYAYTYGSITNASCVIVSTGAGMDGGNGGWPVLVGASQLTDTSIRLYFDEDQIGDSERSHTPEIVTFIVFGQ